jgi:hypothetical protein
VTETVQPNSIMKASEATLPHDYKKWGCVRLDVDFHVLCKPEEAERILAKLRKDVFPIEVDGCTACLVEKDDPDELLAGADYTIYGMDAFE